MRGCVLLGLCLFTAYVSLAPDNLFNDVGKYKIRTTLLVVFVIKWQYWLHVYCVITAIIQYMSMTKHKDPYPYRGHE